MELIKARYNNVRAYNISCNWCGSELRVTKDDLSNKQDSMFAIYGYVICPVCKNEFFVELKDIDAIN